MQAVRFQGQSLISTADGFQWDGHAGGCLAVVVKCCNVSVDRHVSWVAAREVAVEGVRWLQHYIVHNAYRAPMFWAQVVFSLDTKNRDRPTLG